MYTEDMYSEEWLYTINSRYNIYLYGAGDYGKRMMIYLKSHNINIKRILLSKEPSKQELDEYGEKICQYKKGMIKSNDVVFIAICYPNYLEVEEKLKNDGVVNIVHTQIEWYDLNKSIKPEYYPESLKAWYYSIHNERLNLENPRNYNEKICWLKLYDEKMELKTQLADKFLVRKWVAEKIGEEYLIPLYGVWNSFDEIDFDELPESFVLKCNHGSGYNVIIDDKSKIDKEALREQFEIWMNTNPAYLALEMQYKYTNRCIMAEEKLISDEGENDLRDYKFFAFDGKVKMIQVDINRFKGHKRNIYTTDWKIIDAEIHVPKANDIVVEKPKKLHKMIELAEYLSIGFSHVRVDFYYICDKIYFGEMTFTHGGGREAIKPKILSDKMGDWIRLPKKITSYVES